MVVLKPASFKKILKQATAAGAQKTIIIAQEYLDNKELIVKDMDSGEQRNTAESEFLKSLGS